MARARRSALLHAHRHRLRPQDLEDCLSQATLELVARARAGGTWASTAHLARVLEQRFESRVQDRRRAVSGRSPMQAALEDALALGGLGEGFGCSVPDLAPGTEERVLLRIELRRLPRLALALSAEQRLVLASQVSLQMGCAEFCALHARESTVGIQVVVVMSGSAKGTSRRISDRLRIGKAPDNDLVLGDDTVSRHHCELSRAAEGVFVRDLNSTNGHAPPPCIRGRRRVRRGAKRRRDRACRPPRRRSVEVMPSESNKFGDALGHSLAMRTIFGVLKRIAPTDATVLLEGETGTGKDVLARAITPESPRGEGPFVVVDCGAISYSLIESELFGHERGAFTGAVRARQGPSSWPTAAPCSSTRSASSRSTCSRSCCACSRPGSFAASAATAR